MRLWALPEHPVLPHHLTQDAWRTLTAVEMGMKNHELVPAPLVDSIAGLRHGARGTAHMSSSTAVRLSPPRPPGGAFKQMRVLLKHKLVHHENVKYDGYRLTPLVRHSSCGRRCTPPGGAGWGRASHPLLRCTQHARTSAPDCLFSTTQSRRAKEPWH